MDTVELPFLELNAIEHEKAETESGLGLEWVGLRKGNLD